MGYYLRFSDGSGSASANNQVFQISGVSGVLTNLSYTVMETLNAFTGVARYIMDGRRKLDDDVGTSGDRIYTFQTNRSEERRVGKECLPRCRDRKSTRLNSSHLPRSRMPSSA